MKIGIANDILLPLHMYAVEEVPHGADLAGRNAFVVWDRDLCVEPCDWCSKLLERIRSRGGDASRVPLSGPSVAFEPREL